MPRQFATEVVRTLRQAGHAALFAGGCVRDQLLGHEPDDYDVATSARPEDVQALFRRTVAVGVAFGVIEVLGPRPLKVQVATFRSDGPYSDGRRPDQIVYSSAEEDAKRRDFTINGLFFDPLDEKLIDYVGGERDLRDGVLRAIGDPGARFREDRLRMLRAVRFAARFELRIDPATHAAIGDMAAQVTSVSGERIAEEMRKLLTNRHRARGVRLMQDTGLLSAVLPERRIVDAATDAALGQLGMEPSFELALAVLLGELKVNAVAERWRLANTERQRTAWLVKHRDALVNPERLPLHALKPLLAHAGIAELLDLHRAHGHAGAVAWCQLKLREWPATVLDPEPLITGDDLIAMGFSPGRRFKDVLDEVRRAQLDEEIHSRADAEAIARRMMATPWNGETNL